MKRSFLLVLFVTAFVLICVFDSALAEGMKFRAKLGYKTLTNIKIGDKTIDSAVVMIIEQDTDGDWAAFGIPEGTYIFAIEKGIFNSKTAMINHWQRNLWRLDTERGMKVVTLVNDNLHVKYLKSSGPKGQVARTNALGEGIKFRARVDFETLRNIEIGDVTIDSAVVMIIDEDHDGDWAAFGIPEGTYIFGIETYIFKSKTAMLNYWRRNLWRLETERGMKVVTLINKITDIKYLKSSGPSNVMDESEQKRDQSRSLR